MAILDSVFRGAVFHWETFASKARYLLIEGLFDDLLGAVVVLNVLLNEFALPDFALLVYAHHADYISSRRFNALAISRIGGVHSFDMALARLKEGILTVVFRRHEDSRRNLLTLHVDLDVLGFATLAGCCVDRLTELLLLHLVLHQGRGLQRLMVRGHVGCGRGRLNGDAAHRDGFLFGPLILPLQD